MQHKCTPGVVHRWKCKCEFTQIFTAQFVNKVRLNNRSLPSTGNAQDKVWVSVTVTQTLQVCFNAWLQVLDMHSYMTPHDLFWKNWFSAFIIRHRQELSSIFIGDNSKVITYHIYKMKPEPENTRHEIQALTGTSVTRVKLWKEEGQETRAETGMFRYTAVWRRIRLLLEDNKMWQLHLLIASQLLCLSADTETIIYKRWQKYITTWQRCRLSTLSTNLFTLC